jgi:hypothetical protein
VDETAGAIGAVYFEEVRSHRGVAAAHAYGGFLGHLTAWAEVNKIPYRGVPVATIKRHATGKGNANKDAMMAAARARGFSPTDDNEADAVNADLNLPRSAEAKFPTSGFGDQPVSDRSLRSLAAVHGASVAAEA